MSPFSWLKIRFFHNLFVFLWCHRSSFFFFYPIKTFTTYFHFEYFHSLFDVINYTDLLFFTFCNAEVLFVLKKKYSLSLKFHFQCKWKNKFDFSKRNNLLGGCNNSMHPCPHVLIIYVKSWFNFKYKIAAIHKNDF